MDLNHPGFPDGASGKESACQCRKCKRCWLDAWDGKIPWRRKWQPTPLFMPGESHRQRSLAGYSPWVPKSQTWLRWLSTGTQSIIIWSTKLSIFLFYKCKLFVWFCTDSCILINSPVSVDLDTVIKSYPRLWWIMVVVSSSSQERKIHI